MKNNNQMAWLDLLNKSAIDFYQQIFSDVNIHSKTPDPAKTALLDNQLVLANETGEIISLFFTDMTEMEIIFPTQQKNNIEVLNVLSLRTIKELRKSEACHNVVKSKLIEDDSLFVFDVFLN